jgi:glycine dehydrogenase subunit 2
MVAVQTRLQLSTIHRRVKAFFGNYGMMLRALAYILTHGRDGLREATEAAVLNARYVAHGLISDYEKPFDGDPMHEVVFTDKRQARKGVHTLDIAKRLIDYGFPPDDDLFSVNRFRARC